MKYRTERKGAGFSLIEILVVLVVLVIGILAIVRLFPAGFIALRNAQNSTFADRLGQSALEQLKQDNGSLADAIYLYTDAGFDPTVSPGNLGAYTVPPGSAQGAAQFADINKQRYVSGETLTVPAARVVSNVAYPPLYALHFGPVYLPSLPTYDAANPDAAIVPYLSVQSTAWNPQIGDSRLDPSDPLQKRTITNPVDVLHTGQQTYLVDLNAGKLALPAEAYSISTGGASMPIDQVFTLTVQYVVQSGSVTTPATATVTLSVPSSASTTAPYDGGWFDGTTTHNITITGTLPAATETAPWTAVTLQRTFRYKGMLVSTGAPMTSFSTDPYEYYVYGDSVGTASNMGVLAFNPLAAGQNGSHPLQARVSYMTLNWHVLHEDYDVPAGGGAVKLVLDHLKRVGDIQFDGTPFGGLVTNTDTTKQYDILLLDKDTGALSAVGGIKPGTATTYNSLPTGTGLDVIDNYDTLDPAHIQVHYAAGRITLPSGYGGKHLRVFYAGDADWAVAVQKAPRTYTLITTPSPTDFANSALARTPNLYYVPATGTRVYFPPCDAGKTVELDNITYTTGTGATQVQHQVPLASGAISLAKDGTGYYSVDLGYLGTNTISQIDAKTLANLKVGGARGVSVQAVVIWHERNVWRTRTTDTLLTQTQ